MHHGIASGFIEAIDLVLANERTKNARNAVRAHQRTNSQKGRNALHLAVELN